MNNLKYLPSDKKFGIVKGYAFNEIIREKYPYLHIVNVDNIQEGLKKVSDGKLFGFIDTLSSTGYAIQKDFVEKLKITGIFKERWELGIGVRNDKPMLFEILEKCVKNLSPQEKQRIFSKYIAISYGKKIDYRLIMQILFGAFVILMFFVYHNRKLSFLNKELKKLKDELENQETHDPLTNLYNRRYFNNIAKDVMQIALREHKKLSVLMIDIDFFKKINDTYGHSVGDEVIKKLAFLLIENTRKNDITARFGGEEFVVLLPNTDIDGAVNIAEKIRQASEQEIIKVNENAHFSFTVSVGVSEILDEDEDIEVVLKRADKALYKAKESGRNRVVRYE